MKRRPPPPDAPPVPGPNPSREVSRVPAPPPIEIATFDQLNADCRRTLEAIVAISPSAEFPNGKLYRVPCLRLTPAEQNWVTLELEKAMPRRVVNAAGQVNFDLAEPGWTERAAAMRIRARSVALALGVPMIGAQVPAAVERLRTSLLTATAREADVNEIVAVVQNAFTEEVLVALYQAVCPGSEAIGGAQEGAAYATFPEPSPT